VTSWPPRRTGPVAALSAVLVLAGVAGWVVSPWGPPRSGPGPVRSVVLAAGPTGGLAHDYGLALAAAGGDRSAVVRTLVTAGSSENLALLVDGTATFALATADVVEEYRNTSADSVAVRAVARLYDSYVQLVVRADSEVAVHRLADLRGLRVAVGERGSGNALVADRVLAAAGIDPTTDVRRLEMGRAEAVAALRSENIDAFFVVEGLPSPDLVRLASASLDGRATEVRFLDLADVAGSLVGSPTCPARVCAVYHAGNVPAGTYPNLAVSITTVAVPTLLLTTAQVSDDMVRHLTGVVFDSAAAIASAVPAAGSIDRHGAIFTGPVPLHDGARAYYRAAKVAALSPVLAPLARASSP
jgi:TRAP transporter TAXI family solute receptor